LYVYQRVSFAAVSWRSTTEIAEEVTEPNRRDEVVPIPAASGAGESWEWPHFTAPWMVNVFKTVQDMYLKNMYPLVMTNIAIENGHL
jgi:hypothetical protein